MEKVMLAVDCSAHSRRASEYLARVAPHVPNCQVVLFSVTTGIPYGSDQGEQAPQKNAPVEETHGDEDHRQEMKQVKAFFSEVRHGLEQRGLGRSQIHELIKPLRQGVVQDILTEARACGCDTIVAGRRGLSKVQEVFMGSVSSDLIHKASGLTVWIVE